MILRLWLAIALMLLMPSSFGFSYSALIDGAGYCTEFSSPTDKSLVASTALDAGSMSNTLRGNGALHESHFINNGAGAMAQVRADLVNAENYTYSYELMPGSANACVQASESLDVSRATYIRAAATAVSPGLYSAASTEVIYGSLSGYSNNAYASGERATASQKLDMASGHVLTDSVSMHVADGSWRTSQVATYVQGELTKYDDNATSMAIPDLAEYSEVAERSHIAGPFTSRATDDNGSAIRTSDFGTEFDLTRHAWNGFAAMGGSTGGIDAQGYYVNPGEKIQDAINSARPGDTINVKSGAYLENLAIDKNLNINGQSAASTIIDGSRKGSVINITSPCTISNLRVQNGYAANGGGISINTGGKGAVALNNCIISGNEATSSGGGIYIESSPISLNGGTISGNSAGLMGGGIANNWGTATVAGCTISSNTALRSGGGGVSARGGTTTLTGCDILGNSARGGGGVYIDQRGTLTVQGKCRIFGNNASIGGGVANVLSFTSIKEGSRIFGNTATSGAGIWDFTATSWDAPRFQSTTIDDSCEVFGNRASKRGGGILDISNTLHVNSSIVHDNIPDNIDTYYDYIIR